MIDVQLGIDGTGPAHNPALSQHFTPPALAERLVEWALRKGRRRTQVSRWHALEPSAGGGAFVDTMLGRFGHVVAHEIDPGWAAHLRHSYPATRVVEGDYLAAPGPEYRYDFAALNPPYEGGLDGRFVEKAMGESTRVLALVRLNFLAGEDRYRRVWEQLGTPDKPGPWSLDGLVIFRSRPRFSGAVGSPKHDFCALYLTRDPTERWGACCPDWWLSQ